MDAFEEMYETCSQRVYLFLYKLCKSPDIAEELTQETFYQAILSFHRFQGKCDIFTWLASIAKHVYYKYLKKNRLGFDIISIDLINDLWPDSIDGPEELIQNSRRLQPRKTYSFKASAKIPRRRYFKNIR